MRWQDIILTVGQFIFVIALLPSVVSDDKPALSSSLLTGSVLGVFTFVYASLHLWSAAVAAALITATWLLLAWQQYRKKYKK